MVSSLKAQIRQRFVAAVAEIDAQDDRRRAVLLCALVGGARGPRARAAELERFVEARCPDGCALRARPPDPRRCPRLRRSGAPVMLARVWPEAIACAGSTRSCAR